MSKKNLKQSKKIIKVAPTRRFDTRRYTSKDKLEVISKGTFISTDDLLRIAVNKLWVEWEQTNSITVGCGFTTNAKWEDLKPIRNK